MKLLNQKKIETMEANNALQQVISAPSLSKATQSLMAEDLISQVMAGKINPVQAFIQIKAVAEVCDQFLKNDDIVSMTMGAVARNESNLPILNGAKITLTNATRYDYESARDPEYIELLRQKEILSSKMKSREMFLKALDTQIDVLDRESGEFKTIFPPAKKQSQTLRVTFAKQ